MTKPTPPLHYVFGTTASFSHVPPLVNLAISLVTTSPEVYASFLVHANNLEKLEKLVALEPEAKERIKFVSVGEKRNEKEISQNYMDMVYGAGEKYAGILMNQDWPAPSIFIFDITSYWYTQIKSAVEKNLPHIAPLRLVGYNPQAAAELLFLVGDTKNGSLRWVGPEFNQTGIETPFSPKKENAGGEALVFVPSQQAFKLYREGLTESERLVEVPGVPPFYLYERWSAAVDWSVPEEYGWFQFLQGLQETAPLPEAWIGCFPSDVFEPEALAALLNDPFLTDSGKKPFFHAGWFESSPVGLKEDVKSFLDRYGAKEVVYISFGTIVEPGEGAKTLFKVLADSKTPFVFAGGGRHEYLPKDIQALITQAEKEGRAIAPDWVDQQGVLAHPSVMCFVSHCGVSSTVESILAGVPIVTWARLWDQIILSSQIGTKGLGVELIQHREGVSVGRPVAHRPSETVKGDDGALETEIKDAFRRLQGDEGNKIRYNQQRMAEAIRSKRQGDWADSVNKLVEWSRA